MAVIANRIVPLLPGWTFQPGERVPEQLWESLGKAKQRVLLGGRFFLLKHGKKAEAVPEAVYNPAAAIVQPPPALGPQRTPVVWPEYEPVKDTNQSLREIAGTDNASPVKAGFPCSECAYIAASKQALGGHRRGHAKQRARQLVPA